MIHFFKQPISHLALPDKFTYPFHYTPHPLCVLAAEEVKEYIPGHVKEHIVNVETISQPEAQSEDEDNEEEIVHYEDALEELENVLKHETEEDEKDKEAAKG